MQFIFWNICDPISTLLENYMLGHEWIDHIHICLWLHITYIHLLATWIKVCSKSYMYYNINKKGEEERVGFIY
jgi:hypothetical protein